MMMMMMMMWWEPVSYKKLSDSDTVKWGIFPLYLVFVAISANQTYKKWRRERKDPDSQHSTLGGPAGYQTSQLDLITIPEFLLRPDNLYHHIVTGEDDKAAFFHSRHYNCNSENMRIKPTSGMSNRARKSCLIEKPDRKTWGKKLLDTV